MVRQGEYVQSNTFFGRDGKTLETGMTDFDAAEIRSEMRSDPLIDFFARVNPDYKLGKGLPVIFRMSPWKVIYVFFIVLLMFISSSNLSLSFFIFKEYVFSTSEIKSSSYKTRDHQT